MAAEAAAVAQPHAIQLTVLSARMFPTHEAVRKFVRSSLYETLGEAIGDVLQGGEGLERLRADSTITRRFDGCSTLA